jgi:hypothetical protein
MEYFENIKIEEVPANFSYGPPSEIDGKKTI